MQEAFLTQWNTSPQICSARFRQRNNRLLMTSHQTPHPAVIVASGRPNLPHTARTAGRQPLKPDQQRQVAAQASSTPSSGCDELLGSASLSPESLPSGKKTLCQHFELEAGGCSTLVTSLNVLLLHLICALLQTCKWLCKMASSPQVF